MSLAPATKLLWYFYLGEKTMSLLISQQIFAGLLCLPCLHTSLEAPSKYLLTALFLIPILNFTLA